jgi:DNA-binding response OmpR family regulator
VPTSRYVARVLLIEDEPDVSFVLRIVLEAEGHEVLVADDGSRGVAMATRRSPDVIILDVMMPVMDGFAVLEALREDERSSTIPVMMLSALQSESDEERCYRMGAQTYMRKPFDPQLVLGMLQETLAAPPRLHAEDVARQPCEVPLAVILAWNRR